MADALGCDRHLCARLSRHRAEFGLAVDRRLHRGPLPNLTVCVHFDGQDSPHVCRDGTGEVVGVSSAAGRDHGRGRPLCLREPGGHDRLRLGLRLQPARPGLIPAGLGNLLPAGVLVNADVHNDSSRHWVCRAAHPNILHPPPGGVRGAVLLQHGHHWRCHRRGTGQCCLPWRRLLPRDLPGAAWLDRHDGPWPGHECALCVHGPVDVL
mmetsp:Transcript_3721/g.12013  ORF Transcript_3721/g.12013 Transcript_3721/m.12013 type:complete len:209 (-) Transcript_3721:1027-1653(-)